MRSVERRKSPLEAVVLASVCVAYVGWILSLPVFPTQDGPMHLYYAHVMSALFGHGPAVYARFYRIKHVLPPYSVYYYLLIGLSRLVPLFLADKLVICGYIVSFAYGFRYLARAVGPAAEQASLLATMLLLNWPLGMGFVNFCLGVSLALWTLGVWMRTVGQPGVGRKALFVAMCVGLVLAHPVPLLAVLGYCTADLAVRAFGRRRPAGRHRPLLRADFICLGLAMMTLVYVKVFTVANVTRQIVPYHGSTFKLVLENSLMYARGQGLSFFSQFLYKATAAKRVYRLLLVGMVPFGLTLAARQTARERRVGVHGPGWLWLWLTVAMIVVQPWVPHDMNASHYFADRLLIFVWLGVLLAMSGHTALSRPVRLGIALAVIMGTAVTLWTADAPMRAIARQMAHVEASPVEHGGEVGIISGDWRLRADLSKTGLTFNPYLWAAVHYFRHNDAVLYDTPWMDLTVIPLGAKQGLGTGVLSPDALEDAGLLRDALTGSEPLRRKATGSVTFAIENPLQPMTPAQHNLLLPGWTCVVEQPWYEVCTP